MTRAGVVCRPSVVFALAAALAGGCASLSEDEQLTWSASLARTLPVERGEVVPAARFSRLQPWSRDLDGWEPFIVERGAKPTRYRLATVDGEVALEADAPKGFGSGLWRKIHINPREHPIIEWRWRVPRDSMGAASRESPPVRLSLGFDGDASRLDVEDRVKLRMAKALTEHGLPYASLLYVWKNDRKPETVYASPYTDRVRHIVVESGAQRADQWVTVRRNLLEDYRRVFGEEPGDLVGVGIMTDFGDDGSPRRAFYGDIRFRALPATAFPPYLSVP